MSSPTLHVATVRHEDEALVMLRGELDLSTAPALAHQLACREVTQASTVLIDLERLQFADLAGLDPLVAFALPERPGLRVSFTPGSPAVRRLLSITGLDGQLNVLSAGHLAWH
ncbi:MAG: STAS domain-containing protein [Solirubrobacteraceae bacterium]